MTRDEKNQIKIGDIIFFGFPGTRKYVLHRVIYTNGTGEQNVIQTKGDAKMYSDTSINKESVLGKVVSIESPSGKQIRLNTHAVWNKMIAVLSRWGIHQRMMGILPIPYRNPWKIILYTITHPVYRKLIYSLYG